MKKFVYLTAVVTPNGHIIRDRDGGARTGFGPETPGWRGTRTGNRRANAEAAGWYGLRWLQPLRIGIKTLKRS
jgi:hypothetical protein